MSSTGHKLGAATALHVTVNVIWVNSLLHLSAARCREIGRIF
jgi:hypothetical protein